MRIAYLCNVYPAVSHSFVRREIEALEQDGHDLYRFSVRPIHGAITDTADIREASLTSVILEQGWARLVRCTMFMAVSHPRDGVRAVLKAYKLAGKGVAQKAKHAVYFLEAAWLAAELRETGVEHLHAHFGTNPAAIAAIAHAWGGPPYSFTIHGPDEFDAPVQLKLREKASDAKFIAAISSYCRSQLMRWIPERDWRRIRLIRCGLDAKFLSREPTPPPEGSRELLTVARLSEQKGLPLLVDACLKLHKAGYSFHLTIVGYGEMRDSLHEKICDAGLQKHITLAGIKSSDEVIALLLGARAFVLPSFAEGLPVVLMEALALARPVIATSIAGIPELVDDDCGWLIPAGDPEALAEAMTSALRLDVEETFSKGLVGRERVLDVHDVNRNAAALLSAITDAQNEDSPGARSDDN